jgi:hypothetical protein
MSVSGSFLFNQNELPKKLKSTKTIVENEITILIQPFADLSKSDLEYVTELRKYYKKFKVNSQLNFQSQLLINQEQDRADLSIRFLSNRTKAVLL